jgi:hypothetical protein
LVLGLSEVETTTLVGRERDSFRLRHVGIAPEIGAAVVLSVTWPLSVNVVAVGVGVGTVMWWCCSHHRKQPL